MSRLEFVLLRHDVCVVMMVVGAVVMMVGQPGYVMIVGALVMMVGQPGDVVVARTLLMLAVTLVVSIQAVPAVGMIVGDTGAMAGVVTVVVVFVAHVWRLLDDT